MKKKIKMNVSVYVVKLYSAAIGDELLGSAYDMRTLVSLLSLAEKTPHKLGVSLHGLLPNGDNLSGEMSIRDAFLMIQRIRV